jgi:hypothetical protein
LANRIVIELEVSELVLPERAFQKIEEILDAIPGKWWDDNVESYLVRNLEHRERNKELCDACPWKLRSK